MKYQNLLIILFSAFWLPCIAQDVNITSTTLLGEMKEYGVDINNDGKIQVWEAEARKSLEIVNYSIADFTGLEAFIKLENLNIQGNSLTNFDFSPLKKLRKLNLSYNQFTQIDLSKNQNLDTLIIKNNQLTVLNITALLNLKYLDASFNTLNSIDLINSKNLQHLNLNFNQIDKINCTNLDSIRYLSLYNLPIRSIDLNKCLNINTLYLSKTKIKALDIDKNIKISFIEVSSIDSLSSLNLSNQKNLSFVNVLNTPLLLEVCLSDTNLVNSSNFLKDAQCKWKMNCINGLEEQQSISNQLFYPNPSSQYLTIHSSVKRVTIFDNKGLTIISTENFPINISKFSKGIYTLKIELLNRDYFTEKLIID